MSGAFINRRQALAAAAAVGLSTALPRAFAQEAYPSRRIEIVVPFPAGGTADFLARLVGNKLSTAWGQPVVVANKPGATGKLGADAAAQSAPDGYTLLLTSYADRKVLFTPAAPVPDPAHDLVPVALLAQPALVLVAHPSLGVHSIRELVAVAKKGDISYASIGPGTPSHLAMELLKRAAGIQLTHVPYKGSGQALADVVGGHVPLMFDSVVSSSGHVKSGRLRALAVSTAARLPSLPEVPTVAESGVPGFDVSTWAALYVPAGTPRDRIEKLNAAMARILRDPEVSQALAAQGAIVPGAMEPAQVAGFVRRDVEMWRKLVKEAAIQAE